MKAVFIDIDGTLITFGTKDIPDSARRAIQASRAKGNRVYINTGRCRAEVLPYITDIGFDGIICSNAMYIEENGSVLHKESMAEDVVRRAAAWLEEQEAGFFIEGHDIICANRHYLPQLLARAGEERVRRLEKAFPGIREAALRYTGIAKINYLPRPGMAEQARRVFAGEMQVNGWSMLGREGDTCEMTLPGANKANGVSFIMQRLGLDVADAFGFGDAEGDIQMIQRCGTGVAMGNACQPLKAAADYVTDRVDEDGLYHAFAHFGLI